MKIPDKFNLVLPGEIVLKFSAGKKGTLIDFRFGNGYYNPRWNLKNTFKCIKINNFYKTFGDNSGLKILVFERLKND